MKKLTYLFAALGLFMFTACGGGASEESATEAATEVAVCANTGEPCLDDHSCCAVKEEAACCCGDATCDGSCHGEEGDAAHDHSDGADNNHEH